MDRVHRHHVAERRRKLDGLRQHASQVGDRFEQVTERIRERSRQMARMQNLPFELGEGYRYFRLD